MQCLTLEFKKKLYHRDIYVHNEYGVSCICTEYKLIHFLNGLFAKLNTEGALRSI